MKLFQREPTLWLAALYAIVTIVGTFGLLNFTGDQATLLNAFIAAGFAALNAWMVRPISPIAFTYFIGAAVALAASYGYHVPEETLVAIQIAVVPILALMSRGQITPANTPLSRESTGLEVAREVGAPGPAGPVA